MSGRVTNSRISATEETKRRLRDFTNGLGGEYDDAINYLLDLASKKDEAALLAGIRLRDEFKKKYPGRKGRVYNSD